MSLWYKLVGRNPVPCEDIQEAARAWEENRRIAETTIDVGWRQIWVSTVFLGLDHSFGGGPPVLFETMVFEGGGVEDVEDWLGEKQLRYRTYNEAEAGHMQLVAQVRDWLEGLTPPQDQPIHVPVVPVIRNLLDFAPRKVQL